MIFIIALIITFYEKKCIKLRYDSDIANIQLCFPIHVKIDLSISILIFLF